MKMPKLSRSAMIAAMVTAPIIAASVPAAGQAVESPTVVMNRGGAAATLRNAAGTAIGTVTFQQLDRGVQVRVRVPADSGLAPGFHGFHVHDVGVCTAPGFTSAAGHYNPGSAGHGSHSGDNPVLLVDEAGAGSAAFTTSSYSVAELLAADVAVVVHAGADNYANIPAHYQSSKSETPGPDSGTLATGDAGARVACGVVAAAGTAVLPGGYWMVARDGGVFNHGTAPFLGSLGATPLNSPVVGLESTPTGAGYLLAAEDGGVFAFGDASFAGSAGSIPLRSPVVDLAVPPGDARAVVVNASGGTVGVARFAQQDAETVRVTVTVTGLTPGFHGFHVHDVGVCTTPGFTSAAGHYNPRSAGHGSHAGDNPVLLADDTGTATASFTTGSYSVAELLAADVSVVVHASPDNYANIPSHYQSSKSETPGPDSGTLATGDAGGRVACGPVTAMGGTAEAGYWLAAADGGVFAFGDAPFAGSLGDRALNAAIVAMMPTPSGEGYWLVGTDGGVFSFGDAGFHGSTGNITLNQPIVAAAPTPTGRGYVLVARDGGVFAFGDATFHGSTGNIALNQPVVGAGMTPTGHGYWLFAADGGVFNFGDAPFEGSEGALRLSQPVRGGAGHPGG